MRTLRLEAFSDGVLAIIITIMVLEMKVPHGESIDALLPLLPVFFSYVLSFVYVGIYWNNHHHMLHATQHVNGAVLWANLHLLFWLSLVPFVTGWMDETHFAPLQADRARGWLGALSPAAKLSLYLHIPYCTSICTYCGCHTKAVRKEAPLDAYAQTLAQESGLDLMLIATAQAHDDEMEARIARHRADRDERWSLVEEPLNLAAQISGRARAGPARPNPGRVRRTHVPRPVRRYFAPFGTRITVCSFTPSRIGIMTVRLV